VARRLRCPREDSADRKILLFESVYNSVSIDPDASPDKFDFNLPTSNLGALTWSWLRYSPVLHESARRISSRLRQLYPDGYSCVHLRLGDGTWEKGGPFAKNAERTINTMR